MQPLTLTHETLALAVGELAARDTGLARIVERFGPPPLWAREPGFPTLVHIILEQQVSLASARAAFDRLRAAAEPLTPERFLTFSDAELKAIGFSRQKTGYARGLAQALASGELDLAALAYLDDREVFDRLVRMRGIGPWSAHIYLLMALCRPDVWPAGDLALAVAVQRAYDLPTLPAPADLDTIGANWRPWRAVAARILWHFYLSSRDIRPAAKLSAPVSEDQER